LQYFCSRLTDAQSTPKKITKNWKDLKTAKQMNRNLFHEYTHMSSWKK
jgi:hypothetical protein